MIGLKRDVLQPDATAEAPDEQTSEHRFEIRLPMGRMVKPLLGELVMLITVPNDELQAPADSPLLPKSRAEILQ